MSFTFLRMTRGQSTVDPLVHGQGGIRIPESGTAAPTSYSDMASELASSAATDGAGIIGDLTGVEGIQCMAAADTSHGVTPFTIAAITTGEEASVA